jgi:hypothetical protein
MRACERLGCEKEALTQFGTGDDRLVWACEEHGDDLAVGWPLKPDVCPIDCPCRDMPASFQLPGGWTLIV